MRFWYLIFIVLQFSKLNLLTKNLSTFEIEKLNLLNQLNQSWAKFVGSWKQYATQQGTNQSEVLQQKGRAIMIVDHQFINVKFRLKLFFQFSLAKDLLYYDISLVNTEQISSQNKDQQFYLHFESNKEIYLKKISNIEAQSQNYKLKGGALKQQQVLIPQQNQKANSNLKKNIPFTIILKDEQNKIRFEIDLQKAHLPDTMNLFGSFLFYITHLGGILKIIELIFHLWIYKLQNISSISSVLLVFDISQYLSLEILLFQITYNNFVELDLKTTNTEQIDFLLLFFKFYFLLAMKVFQGIQIVDSNQNNWIKNKWLFAFLVSNILFVIFLYYHYLFGFDGKKLILIQLVQFYQVYYNMRHNRFKQFYTWKTHGFFFLFIFLRHIKIALVFAADNSLDQQTIYFFLTLVIFFLLTTIMLFTKYLKIRPNFIAKYNKKFYQRVDQLNEKLQQEPCTICLQDFTENFETLQIFKTPCGHYFHKNCLQNWMDQSLTCPLCKKVIPQYIE